MTGVLARKYAQSLAEVALEAGLHDKVRADLDGFGVVFAGHDELRSALMNPAVPAAARQKIADSVASVLELSPLVVNLLRLLIQNNRLGLLPEIPAAYRRELDERQGIVSGTVLFAAPLSPARKAQIEQQLAAATGRTVRLEYREDPDMIGGAKIQIGSVIYDASVKTQLEEMRRQIG